MRCSLGTYLKCTYSVGDIDMTMRCSLGMYPIGYIPKKLKSTDSVGAIEVTMMCILGTPIKQLQQRNVGAF
jgi:hypothetical protein